MAEEEENAGPPKTFTQEQVNAMLADQKRKVLEKVPTDYEDLKAKASKLDEIEQASKTELEKEREARATAESELAKYRQKEEVAGWAKDIVKGSTIPASVLRGSTREELEAHFNELKELAPQPKRTPVPSGKKDGEQGSRAAEALRAMRQG